jgi:NAD(P)H-hydrate epimerase
MQNSPLFQTAEGFPIPALTEDQMRTVDRIAVEDFGLGLLQMMENAGRNLALVAIDMVAEQNDVEITVLAGSGGNGGGGICCARHLHNHGYSINLFLGKPPEEYRGAPRNQLQILANAGVEPLPTSVAAGAIERSALVIDALIGYSLRGAPSGLVADLIRLCGQHAGRTLSLDIPSGMHSTTGETPGLFLRPDRTLTLALPKTGLSNPAAGELFLADIGIPPEVFKSLGIYLEPFWASRYWLPISRIE